MSASQPYPDSAQFVGHSWRALWRMVRAMPLLWVTFIFTTLALWRIDTALTGPEINLFETTDIDLGLAGVSAILALAGAVVTAAATMTVLRAYLLDDHQDRPIWQVPPGFGRLAAWFVGAEALGQLVTMAAIASGLQRNWLLSLYIGAGLVIAFFLSQYFLLAPALAVRLSSAGFKQAWEDGRGRVWTYIGAMIVVAIQAVIAILVLSLITSLAINAFTDQESGYAKAAGQSWDLAYAWVCHGAGLVAPIILGARAQACLFAEARAAA